jgi:hypothetical protein
MKAKPISMGDVMAHTTLEVQFNCSGLHKLRLWVGMRLLLLAARIIGCGIAIDLSGK